jgi:rhodanese-related sulfurtransferase
MATVRHCVWILITLLSLTASLAFSSEAQAGGWEWVQAERVYSLLEEGSGVWLVDVRSPLEFEKVHIEGAMSISLLDLKYRNYPKRKVYVLLDSSLGQKAAQEAADVLIEKGHTNVYVLMGGVCTWEIAGLPVVRSGSFEPYMVTTDELQWAFENKVFLKVYHVGEKSTSGDFDMPGIHQVSGKNSSELIENLQGMISGGGSLSDKLKPYETVVLVSSAQEEVKSLARDLSIRLKKDVRYLQGGYEAYEIEVNGRSGEKQTVGQCPTCKSAQ